MAGLKKDESGNLVFDAAGNLIWVDGNNETPVDIAAMKESLKNANAESKGRKEEIRKYEARYAAFKDMKDEEFTAWYKKAVDAIEKLENLPDQTKELEAQIAEKVAAATGNLKAQMAEKDKILGEKNQLITDQTNRLNTLLVKTAVQSSKKLNEEVNPKFRALIRRELERAGRVDKEGNVYFVDDLNAKILAGEDAHDATTDEAIVELIKKLGMDDKDFFLSQNNQQGSGGQPNPNAGHMGNSNKKFSEMTLQEKKAYLENQSNLKSPR